MKIFTFVILIIILLLAIFTTACSEWNIVKDVTKCEESFCTTTTYASTTTVDETSIEET